MALGLGGVLAALLGQTRGFAVSPFAGQTWFYAGLLAVWRAVELRPAKG